MKIVSFTLIFAIAPALASARLRKTRSIDERLKQKESVHSNWAQAKERLKKKEPVHSAPPPNTGRIVGGSPATQGAYPWFVQGSGCGASLVFKDIVFSAAHCIGAFQGSEAGVWINPYELDAHFDGDAINNDAIPGTIDAIRIHPNYNDPTVQNDFMVMRLSQPVESVTPIALDRTGDNLRDGQEFTIIGFGTTSSGGSGTNIMLEATVPYYGSCGDYPSGEIDHSVMYCAGIEQGGVDTCQGDSGSPTFYLDSNNNPVQAGVVSWGYGCAGPRLPGVYAKVSGAIDWIDATICEISRFSSEYPFCDGGGGGGGGPNPTPAPTPTSSQCSDLPRNSNGDAWYDSDGPDFDCPWYTEGTNCADYGDGYEAFGLTANQACCACGGGNRNDTPATPSPTPRPTPSPTPRPTPSPTPRPTPSPTPRPTPSPTPTPGSGPTQCADITRPNGLPWHDSDGDFFNCDWYERGSNCADYGGSFAEYGMTANVACCGCGGGRTCQDVAGWYDADGPEYDCAWYAEGNNCANHGDNFENFGLTANQACCACSGGTNV